MDFVFPTDERASRWDLANDFSSPAAVKQFVDALVPPQPNDSNPFFSDALRDLMSSAHTEVYRHRQDESREQTFRPHCTGQNASGYRDMFVFPI
jgi:hypothetical protein